MLNFEIQAKKLHLGIARKPFGGSNRCQGTAAATSAHTNGWIMPAQ